MAIKTQSSARDAAAVLASAVSLSAFSFATDLAQGRGADLNTAASSASAERTPKCPAQPVSWDVTVSHIGNGLEVPAMGWVISGLVYGKAILPDGREEPMPNCAASATVTCGKFVPIPDLSIATDSKALKLGLFHSELVAVGRIDGVEIPGRRHFDSAHNGAVVYSPETKCWRVLGAVAGGAEPKLETLAELNNELYVGGQFSSINGVKASNIAKWDGDSWSALPVSIANPVEFIESVQDTLVVVSQSKSGSNYISVFDSQNKTLVHVGELSGRIKACTTFADGVAIGGHFESAHGSNVIYLSRDGGDKIWKLTGLGGGLSEPKGGSPIAHSLVSPVNSLNTVDIDGQEVLIASGAFDGGLARFSGSSWTKLNFPDGIASQTSRLTAPRIAQTGPTNFLVEYILFEAKDYPTPTGVGIVANGATRRMVPARTGQFMVDVRPQ